MRTLHMFAGCGGGLLADLILGHTPVAAVEWDPYCCAVLRERAADGWFPGLHVHEGDVRMFDPSEYAGRVDCIHAGFPCQDISAAGRGAGITGERSGLVTEVFRAIDAIQPRYVFLENSPLIRTRGRTYVLRELVARGYAGRDGLLAAADVGAPHRRLRWWCLATYADMPGQCAGIGPVCQSQERNDTWGVRPPVADANRQGLEIRQGQPRNHGPKQPAPLRGDWWAVESDVGRVVNGLANRAHRIKALGNGQVPLQAAAAWCLLGGPMNDSISRGGQP